jgi:hypothetical protein
VDIIRTLQQELSPFCSHVPSCKRAKEVQSMLSRSRDRGFCDPLSEMNRLSEQMFGGLMRPVESSRQVPIAVRP